MVLRHEGAYGVDSRTTLIHSVVATAANVHDRQVFPQLLHGQETRASDRGGARRNRTKSRVRAKVELAFLVIKRIFGWAKVRYRRLAKNTNWLSFRAAWRIFTWCDGACWRRRRRPVEVWHLWAIG